MKIFKVCKIKYWFVSILFFSTIGLAQENPLIYSKHWYGNRPLSKGSDKKEMLLIYDLFTVSFDANKKFARWLAYQLSPNVVWGFLKEERFFKKDLHLLDNSHANLALGSKVYKGANQFNYEKGHLAPLGSFKASAFSYQLQYLSNIVPQKRSLNRGPWKHLESKVKKFVNKGHELRIVTGTLYGDNNYGKAYGKVLAPWREINGKVRQIPSGFWKMVSFKNKSIIKTCSFIMPQDIFSRTVSFKKYIVKTKTLKEYTGLIFFQGVKASVKDDCSFLN